MPVRHELIHRLPLFGCRTTIESTTFCLSNRSYKAWRDEKSGLSIHFRWIRHLPSLQPKSYVPFNLAAQPYYPAHSLRHAHSADDGLSYCLRRGYSQHIHIFFQITD